MSTTLLKKIDRDIDRTKKKIADVRQAKLRLRRLELLRMGIRALDELDEETPAKKTKGPKAKVAPGSLADRIISAALEPTTLEAIVEQSNARKDDVKKAVQQLIADGRLARTGHSRGTRYQVKG